MARARDRRITLRTGTYAAGDGASHHTMGWHGGNGSSLTVVTIAGPYHRGSIGEGYRGLAFMGAGDHSLAHEGRSQNATRLPARLVPAYLRLAFGIPELAASLEKLQNLPVFVALWHRFHLPAAEILAPAYAAAELFGALLILAGWQTRTVAALFVVELLSEILLTKRPLMEFGGWMLEWQSLLVVLILAQIGAGPWSVDWRLTGRRARDASAKWPT